VAPSGPGRAEGDGSLASTDTAAGASSAPTPVDRSGGVRPGPRPELSSRPSLSAGTASPRGSTTAGPLPSTALDRRRGPVHGGDAPPASIPASAPAAAPTPQGITDAVGRYAAAVQSRQTSRISRAYPGITAAEVDRWQRFFRPLGPDPGWRRGTTC
jgi:hypothetical protein